MTKDDTIEGITLYTIARVKSYNYTLEYDPNSGSEVEKLGANFLAQGFTDGFIAGFTHKLTGEK